MVTILEQQQHPKNYIESKNSPISSISEKTNGDESHVNRIGVNNFRNRVKNPLYIFCKNYG
jgi:hypothetical protein